MPKTCNHENCKNPVFGGGYCKFHQFLRNKPPKQQKPKKAIPRTTTKRRRESEDYGVLREEWLRQHPLCEARVNHNCFRQATEVHHKRGRGKYYLDTTTWLAICHNCHIWVTENSKEAILLGLSSSRLKKD